MNSFGSLNPASVADGWRLAVVPFEEEDESPFVGMLRVEA
jgi:hypothetical protein